MPGHPFRTAAALTTVAATALAGAGLVGGVASASTHRAHADTAPRAHTTLSIRALHRAINPGGGSVVTGQLRARGGHVANRRIELVSHATGTPGWTKAAVHRTRRHGGVAFRVAPAASTAYQLRFAGNKRQQATRSGVVVIRVRDTTSLRISVADTSIDPGQSDSVNGLLSLDGNPLAGQAVQLRRVARHGGGTLATGTTGDDGGVSFPVTPTATTHYRLVFHRTQANAGARSAIATIHVRQASSLSIRARQGRHGREVVSGDLRGGGHGLANRKVTLQARPSGSSTWSDVKSHRTRRHGMVGFAVAAPTANKDYRLVFSGGPLYDGCVSGVVTVTVG